MKRKTDVVGEGRKTEPSDYELIRTIMSHIVESEKKQSGKKSTPPSKGKKK